MTNDEVISRIADAIIALQDQENTMLPTLRQQLKECEKAIEKMLSAIEAGIITPSTKKRLEELEARREEMNISILQEKLGKENKAAQRAIRSGREEGCGSLACETACGTGKGGRRCPCKEGENVP